MDEGKNPNDLAPRVWEGDESEAFVEFGEAMVPGREEMERIFLKLLPGERGEPFVGVEIGTGTGWLSAAVLREFSGARVIRLNGSTTMLRKAGEELAPYGGRAELRPLSPEDASWTQGLPPVRVFLGSLVLHHLDGAAKRKLFARLFALLEPGGALLFADLMAARTERARGHFAV